ncbi:hypothetical protein PILCRDRAFT_16717 [Piloderma croceum F 1598]|uniref:Uncharacterized protein n=1 Tax=Piloderma croceum (strain F 1598) TaxID=765440 RepID=A0A0C3EGL1_PILCF|nr:hypothetical protein PILCRDRAFT_16717 [Piloderma croceum F 1598]
MPIQSRNKQSCLTAILQGTLIKAHATRDPELPQMYEVFNHPLWPNQRSIVFLADLTIEGRVKALEVQNRQRIPGPGLENSKNSGAVFVNPGEMVFVRDMHGTGDPREDKTHSWLVAKNMQTKATQELIRQVIKKIVGKKELCTSEKASQGIDGTYAGGLQFERHDRAVHVAGAECAYTLGPSHERVPNRSAPHASGKMYEGEMDDHLELQKDIIKMHASAAMTALRQGPPDLLQNLENHAELIDLPRIGTDDNFAYPNMQLNISPVAPLGSRSVDGGLSTSIGIFGGEHIDAGDHEGTFTFVGYPVRDLIEGTNVLPFAALPGSQLHQRELRFSPEWTPNAFQYKDRGWTSQSTWVADAFSIMTPAAHFRFIILGLVFLILYILNQLPASYKVECDTEALLKCFTREREDGKRVNCGEWPSRPEMKRTPPTPTDMESSTVSADVTVTCSTQNSIWETQFALWDAHVDKYASTISIIQVHRANRISNGEVYNPNSKGGRPPVITASVIALAKRAAAGNKITVDGGTQGE